MEGIKRVGGQVVQATPTLDHELDGEPVDVTAARRRNAAEILRRVRMN